MNLNKLLQTAAVTNTDNHSPHLTFIYPQDTDNREFASGMFSNSQNRSQSRNVQLELQSSYSLHHQTHQGHSGQEKKKSSLVRPVTEPRKRFSFKMNYRAAIPEISTGKRSVRGKADSKRRAGLPEALTCAYCDTGACTQPRGGTLFEL